jgi:hypothetical protein
MRRKKKAAYTSRDNTKYYRATYVTPDGSTVQEVFVARAMDEAKEYAAGPNLYGRTFQGIEEFNELIESLL